MEANKQIGSADNFEGVYMQIYDRLKPKGEAAITLTCKDFDGLVYLLSNPAKALRELKAKFKYAPDVDRDHQLPWLLRDGVVVVIRPATDTLNTLVTGAALLELPISEDVGIFGSEKRQKFLAELHQTFDNGAFYAEFSNETRVLNVYYFGRKNPRKEILYQKGFTPMTLIHALPDAKGTGFEHMPGTLHFDLFDGESEVTQEDLAHYVVSYLEDPRWLAGRLSDQRTFFKTSGVIKGSLGGTKPVIQPDEPVEIDRRFASVVEIDRNLRPTVIIDNLKDKGTPQEGMRDPGGPTEPCNKATVFEHNLGGENVYVLDNLTIKDYVKP